jgi:hypothetical protein
MTKLSGYIWEIKGKAFLEKYMQRVFDKKRLTSIYSFLKMLVINYGISG